MISLSRAVLFLTFGFAAITAQAQSKDSAPLINEINIEANREVDQARVSAILPFRAGDKYTVSNVEQGLLRLAESGRYQAVESHYDSGRGRLVITLRMYDTLAGVQVLVDGAAKNYGEGFLKDDIQEVLRLSAGDPIDVDQLDEIRETVRSRLFERGLRSAKVLVYIEKGPAAEQTLTVSVNTGELTRISNFKLEGLSKSDFQEFLDVLSGQKNLKTSIRHTKVVATSVNQVSVDLPLDWIALNQAISNWTLRARGDSYYDFKADLSLGAEENSGRTILISLNRGPRYNLQFTGNTTYWERDLRDKVLDRTKRLGIPFDMRDAVDRVISLYHEQGYANVEIETQAFEKHNEKVIKFKIRQGNRYFLGNVNFEGVSTEHEAAVDLAFREWTAPISSPFHDIYYDEKLFRSRLPLLIKSIRDRGFLQARALEFRPEEPGSQRKVNIDVPLQLGQRFILHSLTLNGNTILSEKEIDEMLDVKIGDPINSTRLFAAIDRIAQRYRELGFIYVKVPDKEDEIFKPIPGMAAIDATIEIQPGPRVYIGQILVQGNKKTHEHVVVRELRTAGVTPGHEWDPYSVQRAEQKLLSLGIFGAAKVDPVGGRVIDAGPNQPFERNERDLKVSLAERAPGAIEFGPGFRTDLGIILFGEFNYRNIGGWNQQIILRSQISHKVTNYQFLEQQYSVTFLEPYIFDDPTRMQVVLSFAKTDDMRFDAGKPVEGINFQEVSLGTTLARQLNKYFKVTQNLYTISLPKILEVHDPKTPLDVSRSESYRIATIGTLVNFDTRDNIFNPTTGWFTGTSFSYSSPHLGSDHDANFLMIRQSISRYFRFGARPSIAMSIAYAHMFGLGDTGGIPANVRLALGGRTSIRSLDENQLRDVSKSLIEQQSLELKLEYRQPVLLDFGLAYFVDAGTVDSLKYRDPTIAVPLPCLSSVSHAVNCMSYAVGFGLRLATPVGPLALDFAFNPSPRAAEDENAFKVQFNIGSF